MKKIYTAIDIGSDTIKFIVGEYFNNKVNVLSYHEEKSKGIRKGLIVDSNLTINAIKDGIRELEKDLGLKIKKAIVNVPDYNSKFMLVTSTINITSDEEEITTDDINRLIKSSVYSKIDKEYELITVVPLTFILDGKVIEKTVGEKGKKLELKGIMITAPKKNIYSVLSVMEGVGIDVVDITISGLCDYAEVDNKNINNKIGAIINLGHETTNVSVFNRGKLMNTETIQLGGLNVDKDLAYIIKDVLP